MITKKETTTIQSSIQITNYIDVLNFMCEDFKRSFLLSTNQSKKFNEIFGKCNTIYRGSEFFNKVWILTYKGEMFNVFTSEKGTTFEIVCKFSDRKSDICLKFIKNIEKLLK